MGRSMNSPRPENSTILWNSWFVCSRDSPFAKHPSTTFQAPLSCGISAAPTPSMLGWELE